MDNNTLALWASQRHLRSLSSCYWSDAFQCFFFRAMVPKKLKNYEKRKLFLYSALSQSDYALAAETKYCVYYIFQYACHYGFILIFIGSQPAKFSNRHIKNEIWRQRRLACYEGSVVDCPHWNWGTTFQKISSGWMKELKVQCTVGHFKETEKFKEVLWNMSATAPDLQNVLVDSFTCC